MKKPAERRAFLLRAAFCCVLLVVSGIDTLVTEWSQCLPCRCDQPPNILSVFRRIRRVLRLLDGLGHGGRGAAMVDQNVIVQLLM